MMLINFYASSPTPGLVRNVGPSGGAGRRWWSIPRQTIARLAKVRGPVPWVSMRIVLVIPKDDAPLSALG